MNADRIRGRFGLAFAVLLGLVFAVSVLGTGHAGENDNPAKDLVAKSVKALGGEKKATGWKTRVDKGLLISNWEGWGELHADCTQWVKKPDKLKIDQDFSAYDHPFFFTYYYNAGEVWVMVNLGVRQHQRYTDRITKTMNTVDGLAHYLTACDTFYMVTDVPDDSLLASASFDRVGIIDDGDTVLFDIDKKTNYPVRRIDESGATHVLLEDYRKTSGLRMPYHVTVYQGGAKTAEYKWDKIKFNAKVDDEIFDEYRPDPVEEEKPE